MVLYIGDSQKAKKKNVCIICKEEPRRVFTYEKKETNENKYAALIYKTTKGKKKKLVMIYYYYYRFVFSFHFC